MQRVFNWLALVGFIPFYYFTVFGSDIEAFFACISYVPAVGVIAIANTINR